MILHPLVSDQINRELLQALGNQTLECFIVGVLEKDRLPHCHDSGRDKWRLHCQHVVVGA
jgi:hypothetical protein